MSGFESRWLDLREPADHTARNAAMRDRAAAFLVSSGDPAPLAVDLGCGTGSTLRALAAHAPGARWRLVDDDPALLAEAVRRRPADVEVETMEANLAEPRALAFDGARLVTASALFDLSSEAFVRGVAGAVRQAGAGFYDALSYDGETVWADALADDAAVVGAFNRHQRSNKGFGPALGPAAGQALGEAFAAEGFAVAFAHSPWRLGEAHRDLEAAFVDGMAGAAAETGDVSPERAEAWRVARRAQLGLGLTVGHTDMLALPT